MITSPAKRRALLATGIGFTIAAVIMNVAVLFPTGTGHGGETRTTSNLVDIPPGYVDNTVGRRSADGSIVTDFWISGPSTGQDL